MYSAGIGELYPRRGVVPAKKYRIELTTEEQQELKAVRLGSAGKQTHARILLLSEKRGKTEAYVPGTGRCVEEGIEAALGRKELALRKPT